MKEEINAIKSQEVNFKNHRNCLPLGLGVRSRQYNSPYGVYATRHGNLMNSH